ncbi:response regulator transcription factor [Aliarcobacter butzleri]|uniref:response regulator transcription factor n=1 Tax=Aliarcobacter butzleri TaxID=28197 RepID=UPI00125ECE23|nr:response regulator transcription factor [Aliarcobacter butzleri]MCG3664935.1 response regulator transcription factor [Aliarcobacter butzleri]MCG3714840.1 response regulator transcription factor [Aliarcobacter butzleri]MCT7594328.1 response regulator transcription factor [Aliarcobacter butzleri]MCT7598951.1 response regulator transcription factor [Aliarcobacter butzleri]MCT7652725.1 response regulator transcription factor [Aliarcobacter butzleri]
MKILLLEDDLILNEIIEEYLISQEHEVITAFSGNEAQDYLYSQTFDLLILDVNVPFVSGFELLKELRTQNIKTPTIFITSLNMVEDMQKGFDSGCDDYLKKPFELKELDLRINNIKRLFNITPKELINISKDTFLDIQNLLIIKNNQKIHLAKKECEVLQYLINSSKTVSIEELSLNLWAYEDNPTDSTIRTYIKNLRKILGEEKIINIRGVGYRFNKE